MGRDDIYPVRMSEVGCQWHAPVAASTVVNTPDDGRRKRSKHVE